ncbi:AAA family ATPase [Persicirhabdus sediminis]|uniref:MoxR family ATPase n=1 Tax=Persicirhabdus sediminis TaxID=454144 RepID=A0A8J7SLU3_9BACT|nr:MoxR family ATPase [Persicirhabdus sediminis]MBK1792551.1 MoxR family ATPase [Persicirhabdus sediminis]
MQKQIEDAQAKLTAVRNRLGEVVVGQEVLVERLMLALICGGHVLIEGAPGLAKTLTVNTLSQALDANFSRVQFTPDLLPSDLTGTLVYDPKAHTFTAEKGPIFANIVLADEINRAPAKVQSSLLEAMQEKQVTLGKETFPLPQPFLVLATQNPIEQEGTYSLPEAQVDRFMFKLRVDYPTLEEELEVMRRMGRPNPTLDVKAVMTLDDIVDIRDLVGQIHLDEQIELYIIRLIDATRNPEKYGMDTSKYVRFGASPRASINLSLAVRAHALMQNRDYVVPQDVKDVAPDVLRHRLAITYRAEAEGLISDDLIKDLLNNVPVTQS